MLESFYVEAKRSNLEKKTRILSGQVMCEQVPATPSTLGTRRRDEGLVETMESHCKRENRTFQAGEHTLHDMRLYPSNVHFSPWNALATPTAITPCCAMSSREATVA